MFGLVSQKRFDKLQEEYNRLQQRIDECEKIQTRNKELDTEIYSLKNQLREVKEKIREQTEADLFFVSAKIQKELLEGKDKKDVEPLYQQQLSLQNLLAQQQQQSSFSPYPGIGAGLTNLFGRR